jgi:hypothetical protein
MPEQEYDTSLPVEEAPAAEVTAPEVVTEAQGQAEEAEAPEIGQVSPKFTVKVGGEDIEVSMEEALQGYQRHADYTRKTQELASQREQLSHADQLWRSIENNPEQTIKAIAAAYGMTVTEAQAAVAQAQAQKDDPFGDLYEEAPDPNSERWAKVEQFMQDQQIREQQASVEAELAAVKSRYGVAFNEQALLEYAIDNDIGSLDAAFRAMSFDAAQQAAGRRQAAARKQQLPPVNPGHPVQAGVLAPGAGSALPSFEEAYAAAQAELEA